MTPDEPPVYLDHNATTPLLPAVVDAMLPYLREHFGNPSSGHVYGRRAREGVDRARAEVARLLGCAPDEVVFTSGGTEANNLAILGAAPAVVAARGAPRHVVSSVIEHPATARPVERLARQGFGASLAPVDAAGRIELAAVERALEAAGGAALVTVMHSNNETGVLQPVAQLARAARARGAALVHTDAAQSAGKVPLDVDALSVDLLSIAGHKLYAPKGVGALYVRRGTPLEPVVLGAGHEGGLRPGTENVASVVGLGAACALARGDLDAEAARVAALRERLFAALRSAVPGLALNGHPTERLPNTLNARFPRVSGTALLAACPEVAASTGSACHDGHESASAVLVAMGLAPDEALGAVRLTLGRGTTAAAVDRAAAALARAYRRLAPG